MGPGQSRRDGGRPPKIQRLLPDPGAPTRSWRCRQALSPPRHHPFTCPLVLGFVSFNRSRGWRHAWRAIPVDLQGQTVRVECGVGCVSEPPWLPLTCFPCRIAYTQSAHSCPQGPGPSRSHARQGWCGVGVRWDLVSQTWGESLAPRWCVTAVSPHTPPPPAKR